MAKTEGLFTEKAVSQILREDLPFTPNPFKGIMKPFRLFSQVLLLLGLVMVCAAGSSKAAMQIDIYGPGQNIVNLAMAAPLSTGQPAQGLGKELDAAIHDNLSFLPFMRLTDPKAVLGGTTLPGYQPPNVDFKRFQLAGADLLVTAGWPQGDKSGSTVELRVYETFSGQFVFGNAYSGVTKEEVQDVADRFCADLMKALTGHGDFFLSTLAFVKNSGKNKRDVWITKPTGRNLRKITDIPGIAMSPSWSLDGRFIVFSHMDDKSHALGVWDRLTNRVQRIRFPGNTVIGHTFTPGNKVAVSLSTGKNPDIFMLNHAFQKERTLEANGTINVSPTFDAAGTKMAFTSNRMGGPQIFMKDLASGSVSRVTKQGNYNTEPSMSPDGTLIAFSRLTSEGNRIFVQDLTTGTEQQISCGPGNDVLPSFAPDSYFIAFTSNRSGPNQIYLTTRHGGDAKKVPTGSGDASFPRWGAIPR